MQATPKSRPEWDDYYLSIAREVAMRSTCRRRQYGAIIVKDNEIISTGYGGAPRGTRNCCDIGACYREKIGARSGEHYEFCRAVHAEQNAIIHASRRDMLSAVLYLVGLDAGTHEPWVASEPCPICKRMIVNAGIKEVVAARGKEGIERFLVEDWLGKDLGELRKEGDSFVHIRPARAASEPRDEERERRLISEYGLTDAIVVHVGSYEQARHAIGRVAGRYFVNNIKTGDSVALSCGETILSLLESLPYLPELSLTISQLSIEGDHRAIHQAPATLVGLLRSKCSPECDVTGLQLPPMDLVPSSNLLRREFVKSQFLAELRSRASSSTFIFMGVGSAGPESGNFWNLAQAATQNQFARYVEEFGISGEINNCVFDKSGQECTSLLPGFTEHVVNVLNLDDIRQMASQPSEHKVVIMATGECKTAALRIALCTGLANVLITGREDADRLLGA